MAEYVFHCSRGMDALKQTGFRKLMFSEENGIVELSCQGISDNIVFVVNASSPS